MSHQRDTVIHLVAGGWVSLCFCLPQHPSCNNVSLTLSKYMRSSPGFSGRILAARNVVRALLYYTLSRTYMRRIYLFLPILRHNNNNSSRTFTYIYSSRCCLRAFFRRLYTRTRLGAYCMLYIHVHRRCKYRRSWAI